MVKIKITRIDTRRAKTQEKKYRTTNNSNPTKTCNSSSVSNASTKRTSNRGYYSTTYYYTSSSSSFHTKTCNFSSVFNANTKRTSDRGYSTTYYYTSSSSSFPTKTCNSSSGFNASTKRTSDRGYSTIRTKHKTSCKTNRRKIINNTKSHNSVIRVELRTFAYFCQPLSPLPTKFSIKILLTVIRYSIFVIPLPCTQSSSQEAQERAYGHYQQKKNPSNSTH